MCGRSTAIWHRMNAASLSVSDARKMRLSNWIVFMLFAFLLCSFSVEPLDWKTASMLYMSCTSPLIMKVRFLFVFTRF